MKQTSLALAITALLSTLPSALVQANEGCAPLTGKESGVDIGRSSTERCLPDYQSPAGSAVVSAQQRGRMGSAPVAR